MLLVVFASLNASDRHSPVGIDGAAYPATITAVSHVVGRIIVVAIRIRIVQAVEPHAGREVIIGILQVIPALAVLIVPTVPPVTRIIAGAIRIVATIDTALIAGKKARVSAD